MVGTLGDPGRADIGGVGPGWVIPFSLQAVSVVFVSLWMVALIYFVVRRW